MSVTSYTLVEHPNPNLAQHRKPRREQPSGVIVVHSAENTQDLVLPDAGAEGVANFISNRTDAGSYHRIADSDSIVKVMPFEWEAWHDGTGTNPHSIGISGAFRSGEWASIPQDWRDACVINLALAAAEAAAWVQSIRGINIPALRITVDQARARVPGFISHAELDPERRTDPGAGFPWDQFLAAYAWLRNPSQEEDMLKDEQLTVHPSGDRTRPAEEAPASSVVAWAHDSAGRAEAYSAAAAERAAEVSVKIDTLLARPAGGAGAPVDYELLSNMVADKLAERLRS
jgi:hypothetical protein